MWIAYSTLIRDEKDAARYGCRAGQNNPDRDPLMIGSYPNKDDADAAVDAENRDGAELAYVEWESR